MNILSKLTNASRSLRIMMAVVYIGLVLYKSRVTGITDSDINNIMYVVIGLIAADSWRPLGVETDKTTVKTDA